MRMMQMTLHRQASLALVAALALSACDTLDLDLRGIGGGFTTADAARSATESRPKPDNRGVISYPNYQVAIARRGDTLTDVATRVGVPTASLAAFNGIAVDAPLRSGEVIALPTRVAEPSPATGAVSTGPILPAPVDVTTLAGDAIDNAPDTTPQVETAPPSTPLAQMPQTGEEPIRHRVVRGETAFTISRLYDVPVRMLADWNGLGSDFAIREGQYLLIPVARQAPPEKPIDPTITAPGAGTRTPEPPSAKKPLPTDTTPPAVAETPPPTDVGETTKKPKQTAMAYPVQGKVIRAYKKGKSEGIDIQAAPGSPVGAADAGTIAAITESAEGVPIIVVRHPSNLLTVYANITGLKVKKGDTVKRGQQIAELRKAPNAYVHFEVRDGFDSVDPQSYLN